jgi:ubiquinone/menaquinone biosynthesis C-methylase UbiE
MKNILKENPNTSLSARQKASLNFIDVKKSISGKVILDLGCGFGWFEKFCIENNCEKVAGLDVIDTDFELVKKKINSSKLELVLGSANILNFPKNSFDTVTAWEVIEHIPFGTEKQMLTEIEKVLKPGGILYLSTPYSHPVSNLLDPAWWFGHRHYKLEDLKTFCESANLEITEHLIYGKFGLVLDLLNFYFSKWILRRERLFTKYFEEIEKFSYSKKCINGYVNIFLKIKKK